jgi:putative intracellular protease/amidase
MEVAIPLFDRFTALDAVGPYEVLSRIPGCQVRFVAAEPGLKRTENTMLAMYADARLSDVREPDVVVVPGGLGTRVLLEDEEILGWIRHAHEHSQWTTSVCTGSLLLGAAGVLDGLEATTHWLEFDALARLGARPVERRVVEQGKVITAAGVSTGIDMALAQASVALFLVSVEMGARLIEERHLLRTHGKEYSRYAARVGRFLPGVGRISAGTV